MIELTQKDIDRFKSNIEIKEENECWIWKRAVNTNSQRPVVTIKSYQYQAKVVAYNIWHGNIPREKEVDWTCDTKRCLNPKHLILVTRKRHDRFQANDDKWCPGCSKFLPLSSFGKDSTKSNGIRSHCNPCNLQNVQNYQRDNLKYFKARRNQHLLKNFGIGVEEYDSMWSKQKGLCAICHKPEKGVRSLCVDHNHATGKIRSLLCARCNTSLGKWEDNIDLLESAIKYLRAHQT